MAAKFSLLYDAEIQLLSDRYLDFKFEQDIDDFVCVQCDRLAIVHFFTNCGHLLCLNCKRIIDNGGFTCPQCDALITNANEQRDEFERRLLALKTKCPNTKYGCQLTTNLAQIPEHVGLCKYTRELKSYTNLDVLDKINEHNGQIDVLKISFTKLSKHITVLEEFKDDLKLKLIGFRSVVSLETKGWQDYVDELKKEIAKEVQLSTETNFKKLVADEFSSMNEEMKKMNFEMSTVKKGMARIIDKTIEMKHQLGKVQRNAQLSNAKDTIGEFLKHQTSIDKLLDSFLFGSVEEQMIFEFLCIKLKINNYDQLIQEKGSNECMSDVCPVYGYHLKAQLRSTINSQGYIGLQLCFQDEKRNEQEVDIKHLPIVTFIIKDLSGHNKSIIRYCYHSDNSSHQFNERVYVSDAIKKPQWNLLISPHDKSMEVLALVEPHIIIKKPLSVDGTIMDTIEHFSRKLEMAKEGLIDGHWSAPFFTHEGGHRVAVGMWLNEPIGRNKRGLLAVISFLSSDTNLRSEFMHEASVTLINQLDATKNITVKKQGTTMEIVSENEIFSGGFLMNDSLTYYVEINL